MQRVNDLSHAKNLSRIRSPKTLLSRENAEWYHFITTTTANNLICLSAYITGHCLRFLLSTAFCPHKNQETSSWILCFHFQSFFSKNNQQSWLLHFTHPEFQLPPRKTTIPSMTTSPPRKSLSLIPSVVCRWMASKRPTLVTQEPPWLWLLLPTQSGQNFSSSTLKLLSGLTVIVSSYLWDTPVC